MADIDIVLERLVTEPQFRTALAKDPAGALAAYDLNEQDLQLLAGSLDEGDDDAQRGVEQRTSKSAVVGLLASLAGGGGPTGAIRNQNPIGVDDPAASAKTASLAKVATSGAYSTDATTAAGKTGSGIYQGDPGPEDAVAKTREAQNNIGALRPSAPLTDADISVGRDTAPASGPLWDSGEDDARVGHEKWIPGRVSEQAPPVGDIDMDGRTAAPVPADYDGDGNPDRTAAPVPADYDGDGIKIEIGAAGQRAPIPVAADDDFLTVEDE